MEANYVWGQNDKNIEALVLELIVISCEYRHMDKAEVISFAQKVDDRNKWLLDSLATYQALSYICEFFNINDETKINAVLSRPNLKACINLCIDALNCPDAAITFCTSGSESKPKKITHSLKSLQQEVESWVQIIPLVTHIYCTVPLKHIYGFIWGVLLPKMLNLPSCRLESALVHKTRIENASLVIGVPALLPLLERLPSESRKNSHLILSTAPLDFITLSTLDGWHFRSAIQIYGSTETGGIGYRCGKRKHYTLRNGLSSDDKSIFKGGEKVELQDKLTFQSNEHFQVVGRKDDKIQVNGYNVCPNEITRELGELSDVEEAVIRVVDEKNNKALKLFIVLSSSANKARVLEFINQRFNRIISRQYVTFGAGLPLNEMGKISDWEHTLTS